jgi:hypothetical protein
MKKPDSTQGFYLIILLTLHLGCSGSRDEVARVASPSDSVEAVLIETNGGATTSFGYQIYLVPKGGRPNSGVQVASFYGAIRNDNAYGVNLKWEEAEKLVLEYLKAHSAKLIQEQATIKGEQVQVSLREGIKDANAPVGGMLHNLKKKK